MTLQGCSGGIENTNYFVTTELAGQQRELVLTLFERLSFEQLPFYLRLMKHLAQRGIPVPDPSANRDGDLVFALKGKPTAVVERLRGSSELQPRAVHCAAVGDMLARMHLAGRDFGDVVVVSPDVGGVARARAFAKQMKDAPLAIIDKRRSGHNVAESLTVIGDVAGKTAILIDDMIDTGGTICAGARLLRQNGATRVLACATHPVFSGPAIERLSAPGLFEEVIVTNSIPLSDDRRFPQLQVLSVANMLGEAIWRIWAIRAEAAICKRKTESPEAEEPEQAPTMPIRKATINM